MRKVRKWIMNDDNHTDSNCFALTIICHGNDKGHLLDKNKTLAWMTELFVADLSDVETLVGKPKIITIQACRGRKYWQDFFSSFCWTHVHLRGNWYPCFGLLVTFSLGFQARVGSFIHTLVKTYTWYTVIDKI